jgi:hypothetical protein
LGCERASVERGQPRPECALAASGGKESGAATPFARALITEILARCSVRRQSNKVWMSAGTRADPSRQIILFRCLLERKSSSSSLQVRICGDVMKTRCDYCRGAFGLIRRRYFDHQFCCEACEEAYKQERARIVARFKSGFYQAITNTNRT